MPLAPGARLGPYEVLALIGAGGMGEVYRARDTRLDRTVAIKVIPAELSGDPDRRARFAREAKTISALNHPHICTLHDIGDDGGTAFLVMEHLVGETLAERLRRGPLPLLHAITIATQIADALAAAHKHGIIHRDLKPANIMLVGKGAPSTPPAVKLLDFGLARLCDPGDGPLPLASAPTTLNGQPLTGQGTIAGTLEYMAPEQLEGRLADARTDLFAFGTILYEMVTGRRAFEGASTANVVAAILEREPAPLAVRQPVTPPALEHVVRRCLAKNPDDRWDTAHDVAEELRWISQAGLQPAPTPPSPRRTRRRVVLLASAVIALTGLAGAAWVWTQRSATSPESSAQSVNVSQAGQRKIMLAVLPVDNLSRDPAQDYFSDGLTEEMIAQLGRVRPRQLGVIARTSAMRYKRTDKSIEQIGRELGVDYILESSVRRDARRARITVQLIQVRDQTHLWAESYDREVAQILSVQNDVAQRVVKSLSVELLPDEQTRLASARAVNPEAYDLYLKGRHHWFLRTAADLLAAADYFRAATKADPTFALAYAGLGDTYGLYNWYRVQSARESFPQARAAAARALELDSTLLEAQTTLAFINLYYDWDWAGAEARLRQVLERRPGDIIARQWYAEYQVVMGRTDAAIREIKRAEESDPLSPLLQTTEAACNYFGRRYPPALQAIQRALSLDPNYAVAYAYLGRIYEAQGAYTDAIAAFQRAHQLGGGYENEMARVRARSEGRPEAMKVLGEMVNPRPGARWAGPVDIATMYAALGENDQAMAWLEKAFEGREVLLARAQVDPLFDTLRSDPRFKALVRRMHFPGGN